MDARFAARNFMVHVLVGRLVSWTGPDTISGQRPWSFVSLACAGVTDSVWTSVDRVASGQRAAVHFDLFFDASITSVGRLATVGIDGAVACEALCANVIQSFASESGRDGS